MKHTLIQPSDLNYDHYENTKYDEDIIRVIPGYEALHHKILLNIRSFQKRQNLKNILELGIGTGLTSEKILKGYPQVHLVGVDFSEQMMKGAKKRLSRFDVEYFLGDYASMDFLPKYNIVISVIGFHHQTNNGKKKMFQKIFDALLPGGMFLLGDLFTYKDKKKAAKNEAQHFHHLVSHASDEKTLEEWAYHHKYLNLLAPLEDQQCWMREAGFTGVEAKFEYMNTGLLVGYKN